MTRYLARKPMLVAGQRIEAGEPVPMEKLTGDRRRQLIDQKRVFKDKVAVTSPKPTSARTAAK